VILETPHITAIAEMGTRFSPLRADDVISRKKRRMSRGGSTAGEPSGEPRSGQRWPPAGDRQASSSQDLRQGAQVIKHRDGEPVILRAVDIARANRGPLPLRLIVGLGAMEQGEARTAQHASILRWVRALPTLFGLKAATSTGPRLVVASDPILQMATTRRSVVSPSSIRYTAAHNQGAKRSRTDGE
jgi:hypothetical protein